MPDKIAFQGEEEMLAWSGFAEVAMKELIPPIKLDENGKPIPLPLSQQIYMAEAVQYADVMLLEFRKRCNGG